MAGHSVSRNLCCAESLRNCGSILEFTISDEQLRKLREGVKKDPHSRADAVLG